MAKTLQDVANEIVRYIQQSGVAFSSWYVGIASDPSTRLFTDHNVAEKSFWIYRNAGSEENARAIEKWLIDNFQCQGDTGGGDRSTHYVYSYVITPTTKE